MLRSLGYAPRDVLLGMLTESFLLVLIGSFIGIAIGLQSAGLIFKGTVLSPDWIRLGLAAGVPVAVVVLLTLGPAWQASRLRPSEALRIVN